MMQRRKRVGEHLRAGKHPPARISRVLAALEHRLAALDERLYALAEVL